MNFLELIKMALSALNERKLRTSLTMLMVVIGSTLITSLNGLNAGVSVFIYDQLSMLGGNMLIISPSGSTNLFNSRETGKIPLTSQTVKTLSRIKWVDDTIPFIRGVATIQLAKKETSILIVGMDQNKFKLVVPKAELLKGVFVSPTDSAGIVLGYKIAYDEKGELKFNIGQTLVLKVSKVEVIGGTQKVVLKEKTFQVKGVLKELGNQLIDEQAYVSLSAAAALFGKTNEYDGIYVITKDTKYNDEVEKTIRRIYGSNIGITSPKAIAETINNIVSTFNAYIFSIAFVSLLVGAIGIITTLFTSVMERTREIGLLKALGFNNTIILLLFLFESMIIGGAGGVLGFATGIIGAHLLAKIIPFGITGIKPVFYIKNVLYIWLLVFTLSILAGLYPAWRASKLNPIEALRKE
ncbi:MAG: FtsX-like permease family protein [Candidatus Bathyarchaeia archaeon]|nr:ABC transporter permease [Candidatus Bathyarchaeota archaeon]